MKTSPLSRADLGKALEAAGSGLPMVPVVAAVAVAGEALPPHLSGVLLGEDGVLELVSAAMLGGAALVGLIRAVRCPSLAHWASAVVLAGLVLRELDFQKRYTYRSIESLGFYTRPIAAWDEKLLAALVLAGLGAAAVVVGRAAWHALRRDPAGSAGWLSPGLAAVFMIAGALVSEKFLGFLVAEEVFETAFAGYVLRLVWGLREEGAGARLRRRCVNSMPAGCVAHRQDRWRVDDKKRAA